MKKQILPIVAVTCLLFFTACADSTTTDANTGSSPTNVEKVDTVKKTTISVGPDGVDVKTKNTDVKVSGAGAAVGTKEVKVDVKSGK
ncbi:MAG: hypothetical protein ABI472_00645 [Ginsengibacter sp.]